MKRLKTIIFSRNRASQLRLLLESININANDLFDEIHVLYTADGDHIKGYEKLMDEEDFKSVIFHKEDNFRKDLFEIFNNYPTMFTSFLVDDVIFYINMNGRKNDILARINDDVVCFSLRLGLNCSYSHPANISYQIEIYNVDDDFIKFDYTRQQAGDFRYPLSTDGHIFKTKRLREYLNAIAFSNPNTMESNLQGLLGQIPRNVVSFNHSKIFSCPVNLVNTSIKNRFGLEHSYSQDELNERYLNGEVIDFNTLEFMNVNGPHKEIEYKFKKINNVT